jgi:outer membrane receptor protein involved in Fe transport
VPGFTVAQEIQGILSLGFRGMWANEGKILLLFDGHEINERLYGSLAFGNHLPAEIIERVEIIRGPGSVVYGQFAELAVINVVTRTAADLDGAAASLTYGQMGKTLGRVNLSGTVAHASELVPGLSLSLAGALGWGRQSTRTYNDFYGNSYSYGGRDLLGARSSAADMGLLTGTLKYQDLQIRFLYDNYRTHSQDGADVLQPVADQTDLITTSVDARYDWRLSNRLTLTPYLSYKRQLPWLSVNRPGTPPDYADASPNFLDKTVERYLARLGLNSVLYRERGVDVRLLVGGEAYVDRAWMNDPAPRVSYQPWPRDDGTTTPSVRYEDVAGFAEVAVKNPIADLTGGCRLEYHSAYGANFVPRVGLTRVIGPVHAKLLYSESFRAPTAENFRYEPHLKPEKTRAVEGELGYQPTAHLFVVANGFWMKINEPIIYTFVPSPTGDADTYINQASMGSVGVELEARVRYPRWYGTLSYAYYTAAGLNQAEPYNVETTPGQVSSSVTLGMPQHKLTLNGHVQVFRHLSVNPSAILLSGRWGYLSGDGVGNGIVGQTDPTVLLNVYVRYTDLLVPGLDLGLGVFNLLDVDYRYLQPYGGWHAPGPAASLEVLARLSYTKPF